MKKNGEWDEDDEQPTGTGEEGDEGDQMGGMDMPEGLGMPDDSEDGDKDDKADRPGDEHMFEQFLKSGDYQSLGKRNRSGLDFEDEDELVFSMPNKQRTHTDTEIENLMKIL